MDKYAMFDRDAWQYPGFYGYYLESQSKYASEWYTHELCTKPAVLITHAVKSHEQAPKGAKFVAFVTGRV